MDSQPLLSNPDDSNYNQATIVWNWRKGNIKVYGAAEKPIPVASPVVVPFENGIPVATPVYPAENLQTDPPVVVVLDKKCPEVKEEGMC